MQSKLKCALISLIFIVIDLFVSIMGLSWHGSEPSFDNIHRQLNTPYSFFRSTIDLFLLTLIRMAFISFGCAKLFLKHGNLEKLMSGLGI